MNRFKINGSNSSKFGLNKDLLDERNIKRNEIYDLALEEIKNAFETTLDKYTDNDIVSRYSLEEWLIQELIKDFRIREGYKMI